MNISPVLSVIIPCYNVEKYIERCARSLFEQTLCLKHSVEFIFVNDCTPDNSMSILQNVIAEYADIQPHISVLNLEKNSGLYMARHHGLVKARGEYIAHIDSDDFIDKTMFEKMYNTAIIENADMVWCGTVHELQDGRKPVMAAMYHFKTPEEFLRQAIHDERIWCVWGKLYRRSIALNVENELPHDTIVFGEDLRRTVFLLQKCKKIAPVPEELYHYCENPTSISKAKKNSDFFPDVVKNGDFLTHVLPEGYSDEIILYKQKMLWNAIVLHTPSTYKLYPSLWPEAKQGILKNQNFKLTYRFFLWLANFSFPLSVWLWRHALQLWMRLMGKAK